MKKLKIYFKDTSFPWVLTNVTNVCNENGLLRITQNRETNQWFPIENIFRIVEIYD